MFYRSFECFSESEDEGILEIQLQIEELITELKRTAQPTQVGNRHDETDTVIIFESFSESEDGVILEIQAQMLKVSISPVYCVFYHVDFRSRTRLQHNPLLVYF